MAPDLSGVGVEVCRLSLEKKRANLNRGLRSVWILHSWRYLDLREALDCTQWVGSNSCENRNRSIVAGMDCNGKASGSPRNQLRGKRLSPGAHRENHLPAAISVLDGSAVGLRGFGKGHYCVDGALELT
jgi:hypothetical protein